MKTGWCQFYTGLLGRAGEPREGRRCKAGVLYDDVKRMSGMNGGLNLPCIGHPDAECALYEPVTTEQEQANSKRALARLTQVAEVIASGRCPHCGRPMTSRKVGQCQYAKPCGHRLNEIPIVILGLES